MCTVNTLGAASPAIARRFGWQARAPLSSPTGDQVHVWQFNLRRWDRWHSDLARVLTVEETQRFHRLRLPAARRQATRSRGLLRHLLSRYTLLPPARITLACSANGKPMVATAPDADLRFNVSHSGNRALIAITCGRSVGIDVEEITSTVDIANLVEQFFSPGEINEFHSLPAVDRRLAFFAGWTRKEAVAKAVGTGIGQSPAAFHVTLSPQLPARLLALESDPIRASQWSLADLPGPAGYCQALALEGPTMHPLLCHASPRWLLGRGH